MTSTDTDTAAPPVKTTGAAGTSYIVLFQDADNNGWYPVDKGPFVAANPAAAIKAALATGATGGTYVALPTRSFRPVKVKVETKTHLRLEDA